MGMGILREQQKVHAINSLQGPRIQDLIGRTQDHIQTLIDRYRQNQLQ